MVSSWPFVNSNYYSKPCLSELVCSNKLYNSSLKINKTWKAIEYKVLGKSWAARTAENQPELVYLEDVNISGMYVRLPK